MENIFDSVPGFELIEHTPGYTVLKIPSGFTVKVGRAPPFMFDLLDRDDIRDPGPLIIKIKLLPRLKPEAEIEQDWLYEPPKDDDGNIIIPDREESPQAWIYFQQWRLHEKKRVDTAHHRAQIRWDLLLLNSMEIIDGPVNIEDDGWLEPLLYLLKEPESVGERKLLFLKTQVITGKYTKEFLERLSLVEEVTIEGLKQAFDSFLRQIQRQIGV